MVCMTHYGLVWGKTEQFAYVSWKHYNTDGVFWNLPVIFITQNCIIQVVITIIKSNLLKFVKNVCIALRPVVSSTKIDKIQNKSLTQWLF